MWKILNYCVLVFVIGCFLNIKICFAQNPKSSTFNCGLWGGSVSPKTDDFRFHSDSGFAIGGVAIISNPDVSFKIDERSYSLVTFCEKD